MNNKLIELSERLEKRALWFAGNTPASDSDEMMLEAAGVLREVAKQYERFHHPECPHRHELLIGNCCENNDAALLGMQHWDELRKLREIAAAQRPILDLLARIHRDGGHYTDAHGIAKSAADAENLVIKQLNQIFDVKTPEVRNNSCGTLDEVVGTGFFHLEQMDDTCWWMSLSSRGQSVVVYLQSKEKITATAFTEPNEWNEDE